MYSAKVMDHFEHPRNVGEIEEDVYKRQEEPCRYMSVKCTVDIKKTYLNYRSFQWLSLTSFTKQYRI